MHSFSISKALIAAAFITSKLASAAVIDVFVGGTNSAGAVNLRFTPPSVTANVGDSIRFTFGAKNHSVAQSSFAAPCSPLASGFFSGFMPVAADQTTDLPQFWVPVIDTKPIWAYCSQTGHCGKGMVFAVNAPADPAPNSFNNFLAAAEATAPPAAASGTTSSSSTSGYGYGGGYSSGTSNSANVTATSSAVAPAATGSGTSTSSGSPTVHTVVVGGSAGLVYTPNIIQASPGDVVSFQFQVKNHTVTQSTFAAPCTPKTGGVTSGFMPVAAGATDFPVWNLTVNDTTPIWGFCEQANHCEQGMVFAINPVETGPNTFENFKAAAAQATPAAATSSSSSSASDGYGSSGTSGAGRTGAKLGVATLAMVGLGFALVF